MLYKNISLIFNVIQEKNKLYNKQIFKLRLVTLMANYVSSDHILGCFKFYTYSENLLPYEIMNNTANLFVKAVLLL